MCKVMKIPVFQAVLFFLFFPVAACCQSAGVQDATLRVDYIFNGTDTTCDVSLASMSTWDGWDGRRVNMKEVPVSGNGEICMCDALSGDTLWRNSFCTLFQEWQATPEAKSLRKAFQNSFLMPMPRAKADVSLTLFDHHGVQSASFTHRVDPDDILIRKVVRREVSAPVAASLPEKIPYASYLWRGGNSADVIDVAVVAEGYTAEELPLFMEDARTSVDAIFSHEPFSSMRDRFNFIAVAVPSADSGVSVPREGLWKSTPVASHFDTFYSDRYLTTENVFLLADVLAGLPYEHIIILANTQTYGGGGIYDSYTLTTAHHSRFRPVVVHEFGHSFAALADEYAYAGDEDPYYFADVEPWEQNITTQCDFASKWQDMLDAKVEGVGLFEGAGYQMKGVWRPAVDCRMRTNEAEAFCPVCQRAIRRMIEFYTKENE